ncbi:MAG: TIGR03118 family protein, partial [Verrucomicrobia bacterium]|nr:TIGR03118 family protein [Verrucomicrobiota bacterium]
MKTNSHLDPRSWRRALSVVSAFVMLLPAAVLAQQYQQTNLDSDTMTETNPPNPPNPPDPDLKNPWGIARGTGSPWWISDNMAGVSTLYNGTGAKQSLRVKIPATPPTAMGSPTGIVSNGSKTDFIIPMGLTGAGLSGAFIFASFDGTISAWNFGLPDRTMATAVVPGSAKSILTGATIAQVEEKRFLYVADLEAGKIKVYDTNFKPVEVDEDAFDDDHLSPGFVPFNIQNIGGNLYVAYAKQNQTKTFVDFGAGLGFVDVFSPRGRLLMRLEHGDWFNAPWGLTLAPSDFGTFSHKVIVGQFGSGEITAFDAVTGRFEGKFKDPNNAVIRIDGLWALAFGDGVPNSDPPGLPDNALYFTAGPNMGHDGLFGTLTPVAAD